MSDKKTGGLQGRVTAKTPKFFRIVRTIGVLSVTVGGVLATVASGPLAPLVGPAALALIAKAGVITAVAGASAAAVSQMAREGE